MTRPFDTERRVMASRLMRRTATIEHAIRHVCLDR